MSKPKAPPPPDYAAAATAQGAANTNSAIATNFLNQADQIGPDRKFEIATITRQGLHCLTGRLFHIRLQRLFSRQNSRSCMTSKLVFRHS
jgi:hypothetical protein